MAGITHKAIGAELTQSEFEASDSHALASGTSFPGTPSEGDLFYRTDEHKWYIYNGSTWVELTGAGGTFDIFDKFREFIPWLNLDGFINTTGVELWTPFVRLTTTSESGNTQYIRSKGTWEELWATGKEFSAEWSVQWLSDLAHQTILLHLTDDTSSPPPETADHLGFKIDGADIYASNADGTTQKQTDTTVNAPNGYWIRLKVVALPGTNIKFYVDGVLKTTHTTNLPAPAGGYLRFNVSITANEANAKQMELRRFLIERSY